ncbi:MAG: RIP metalloprotease RseP [Gemmatimonadales bacterium]
MMTVLAFIVVLGVLVFVHELGHFLAAKWAGIHVHRFSVGLGAPIKALTFTRGGTEYSVSWVPLGGYVKMASREEQGGSDSLEGGAASLADVPPDAVFEAKPIWKRMIVIMAGVVMNVLFAWAVFAGLLLYQGKAQLPVRTIGMVAPADSLPEIARPITALQPGDSIVSINGEAVNTWDDITSGIASAPADSVVIEVAGKPPIILRIHRDQLDERIRAATSLVPFMHPVVGMVQAGRPAAAAGMERGDTILEVAGIRTPEWNDVLTEISARPAEDVALVVSRGGERITLQATTSSEPDPAGGEGRVGRLGFGVETPRVLTEPLGLFEAIGEGWSQTANASTQVIRAVRGLLTGRVSTRELGGPIQIGQLAGQTAQLGFEAFLLFMAVISVNLAVMNLLPIPVLDGGQMVFLIGEAVMGRPLSPKLRERFSMLGLVMILMLMGLAFSNDIRRLLGWL